MRGPPMQALPTPMATCPSSSLAAGVPCLELCRSTGFCLRWQRAAELAEPLPGGAWLTLLLTPSAHRRHRQQLHHRL